MICLPNDDDAGAMVGFYAKASSSSSNSGIAKSPPPPPPPAKVIDGHAIVTTRRTLSRKVPPVPPTRPLIRKAMQQQQSSKTHDQRHKLPPIPPISISTTSNQTTLLHRQGQDRKKIFPPPPLSQNKETTRIKQQQNSTDTVQKPPPPPPPGMYKMTEKKDKNNNTATLKKYPPSPPKPPLEEQRQQILASEGAKTTKSELDPPVMTNNNTWNHAKSPKNMLPPPPPPATDSKTIQETTQTNVNRQQEKENEEKKGPTLLNVAKNVQKDDDEEEDMSLGASHNDLDTRQQQQQTMPPSSTHAIHQSSFDDPSSPTTIVTMTMTTMTSQQQQPPPHASTTPKPTRVVPVGNNASAQGTLSQSTLNQQGLPRNVPPPPPATMAVRNQQQRQQSPPQQRQPQPVRQDYSNHLQQQQQQQYQQQHYQRQQQRLPHHYQHQQQQQRHPSFQQKQRQPVWKSLWQRVEKGLDTLADVENSVSTRASQMVGQASQLLASARAPLLATTTSTQEASRSQQQTTSSSLPPRNKAAPTASVGGHRRYGATHQVTKQNVPKQQQPPTSTVKSLETKTTTASIGAAHRLGAMQKQGQQQVRERSVPKQEHSPTTKTKDTKMSETKTTSSIGGTRRFGATQQGKQHESKASVSSAAAFTKSSLPFSLPSIDDQEEEEDESDDEDEREKVSTASRTPKKIRAGSQPSGNDAYRYREAASPVSPTSQQTSRNQQGGSNDSRLYGRKDSPFMKLQQQYQSSNTQNQSAYSQPMNRQSSQQQQQQQPPRSGFSTRSPPPRRSPLTSPQQQQQQPRRSQTAGTSIGRPQPPARPPYPDDDDDEGGESFLSKVKNFVPTFRMPSIPSIFRRGSGSQRAYAAATMDVWNDDEVRKSAIYKRSLQSATRSSTTSSDATATPLLDLLSRTKISTTRLLSSRDEGQARFIGQKRALFDFASLAFFIIGLHQMPLNVNEMIQSANSNGGGDASTWVANILGSIGGAISAAGDGWALYAFAVALLSAASSSLLFDQTFDRLSASVGDWMKDASSYSQLYMRLVASEPLNKLLPDQMKAAIQSQFVETARTSRLRTFVTLGILSLILLTVSVVRPIAGVLLKGLADIVQLEHLQSWPIEWVQLGTAVSNILLPAGGKIKDLIVQEWNFISNHPGRLASLGTLLVSLIGAVALPMLETKHRVRQRDEDNEDDDDEEEEEAEIIATTSMDSVAAISNLGSSSASRLSMLSKSGDVDSALERWRSELLSLESISPVSKSLPLSSPSTSLESSIRLVGYSVGVVLLLVAPLAVHFLTGHNISNNIVLTHAVGSLLDVTLLLAFVGSLSLRAIQQAITSSSWKPRITSFVQKLHQVQDSVIKRQQLQQQQRFRQMGGNSINPQAGITVRDLWAAHVTRRAWAAKGVNLDCNSREVVVILGDEGSGKTRLLTAIAESMLQPLKKALSTTKVRGTITLGGLDTTRWDVEELGKRVGLLLHDVRTISNQADLLSGSTLLEILNPTSTSAGRIPTAQENGAIQSALMMTGLSNTLVPRLPSKLGTVVTSKEDDLIPSGLRPRCHILSPTEWSRVLLARVMAQAIFDNNNNNNNRDAPLMGSVLLLDDVTTQMSELEEARFLYSLRQGGAASIVTSHRWATGRLADRIVVLKDGAIVEVGTHNQLLGMGPHKSLYASKWHQMANT